MVYAKPGAGMETHWEEVIQCMQPEKRWEKGLKKTDFSLEADDTESELIAIPESDLSDSTLHGSVQGSFEEGIDEAGCSTQMKSDKLTSTELVKTSKETYISQIIKKSTNRRPTWFIGSEEEFLRAYEVKKAEADLKSQKSPNEFSKNCSKIMSITTSTSNAAMMPVIQQIQTARTMTTDSHKQVTSTSVDAQQHVNKPSPLGKHKKIVEPSITPVCTPISDCEDCYKSNQLLPAPSLERLLPIGSARSPGQYIIRLKQWF